MKPIRKMRLFAAALAVACLLAATGRTVAAGRGKAVLTGVVYGDGAPLAGVCVSDGVQFATTDAAGRYRIESDKSAGFVFAVTPSNWVAAEADGVQPLFWAALDEADARDEQHDFHFASVDQSRYTVMFFTDLHLTNSSEKRDLDHYRSIALASLSDEAAQITGSLGMLASASLGDGVSLFEPSAGSAPDIAGLGIANPLAQILSAAMLLTYALDMGEQAAWIETAVARVLDEGWRTRDIADANTPADKILGTAQTGDKVIAAL